MLPGDDFVPGTYVIKYIVTISSEDPENKSIVEEWEEFFPNMDDKEVKQYLIEEKFLPYEKL